MSKQLFFSHDWKLDSMGRDNHKRVHEIVKTIRKYGYTTWFDEDDMNGNIDAAMADGIEQADAVIVCITESYCNKINNASRDLRARDNCLKEWTYAHARNKLMIPLIMEPNMLNTSKWPAGVVSMYMAATLYISAVNDNDNMTILSLIKMLEINGIKKKILPPILNTNKTPFLLERNSDYSDETSPISPQKKRPSCDIIRSKTTNFTFARLPPIHFTPISFLNPPIPAKTRVRAKSEVIRGRRFSLNCKYIPDNLFLNSFASRRVSI